MFIDKAIHIAVSINTIFRNHYDVILVIRQTKLKKINISKE